MKALKSMDWERYLTSGTKKVGRGQFSVGECVVIQDPTSKLWDTKAKVESIRDSGRSYWLITDEGSVYLRNRKFLKKQPADQDMLEEPRMKDKTAESRSGSEAEKP